jgi:hypothetical protein
VAGLCKCEFREAIAAVTYRNLGPWLIMLAPRVSDIHGPIDVYRVGQSKIAMETDPSRADA